MDGHTPFFTFDNKDAKEFGKVKERNVGKSTDRAEIFQRKKKKNFRRISSKTRWSHVSRVTTITLTLV